MVRDTKTRVENKPIPKQEVSARPPVVAILGHVDHGKTSLLDFIRKTHVAEKETGGITQRISACQIDYRGRKITFIDTPGHEAFSAMRARGGQVSDIALLVVAADDGVMPQTRESIAHIKAANIPFLVAINKIDLPGVNMEKVKKQLAEEHVLVEGYGGDIVAIPISAKTGQGVEELLEMISLLGDMAELEEEADKPFLGVTIEARLDKSRGPLASLIVKKGVLRVGDPVFTDSVSGKARSLTDPNGKDLREAGPSAAVEVLGFSSVPKVGEIVKKITTGTIEEREEKPKRPSLGEKLAGGAENEIRLILKADYLGSLEAVTGSLEQLKKEDQLVKIYYQATGNITEGDVLLAAATGSLIIGFNVSISSSAKKLAEEEKVLIRSYNLIYELLDELKEGLEALKKQKAEEKLSGEAEIIAVFKMGASRVAGCHVNSGKINKSEAVVLRRGDKRLGESKIVSMKHRETDITQANEGEEFGAIFEKDLYFTKGDIIVAIGPSVTK